MWNVKKNHQNERSFSFKIMTNRNLHIVTIFSTSQPKSIKKNGNPDSRKKFAKLSKKSSMHVMLNIRNVKSFFYDGLRKYWLCQMAENLSMKILQEHFVASKQVKGLVKLKFNKTWMEFLIGSWICDSIRRYLINVLG